MMMMMMMMMLMLLLLLLPMMMITHTEYKYFSVDLVCFVSPSLRVFVLLNATRRE